MIIKCWILPVQAVTIVLVLHFLSPFVSAGDNLSGTSANADLCQYIVQSVKLPTTNGVVKSFKLYVPEPGMNWARAPYPVVVLIHGFLRTGDQQRGNACYLAQRGFIVLTPDTDRAMLTDENRMENVSPLYYWRS